MKTHPALLVAAVLLFLALDSPAQTGWRSGTIHQADFGLCWAPCVVYRFDSDTVGDSMFIYPDEDGWVSSLEPYLYQHVAVYGFEDICTYFCTTFFVLQIQPLPSIVPLAPIEDLTLHRSGPGFRLHWSAPTLDIQGIPQVDVEGYRVHGSRDPWFEPAEDTLLGTTTDTLWNLPWPGANDPRWFRVVALGQSRIDLP